MSNNLIALQNKFLGVGQTVYDKLSLIHEEKGAVTDADIAALAQEFKLPPQHVRATAKFYEELRHDTPSRRSVKVCNGEACRAAGCASLERKFMKALEIERMGEVGRKGTRLENVACLGYCGMGPNVMVDGLPLTAADAKSPSSFVKEVLSHKAKRYEEPHNKVYLPAEGKPCIVLRNFGHDVKALANARAAGVYGALEKCLREVTPEQVVEDVVRSGLRGRGGAGFPTGLKFETVRKSAYKGAASHGLAVGATGRKDAVPKAPEQLLARAEKFVVVNADEGDAGSYIDKELMERDPHSLIEGALIAAYACGAQFIYFYIRFEYPRALAIMQEALAEAQAAGLVGERILNSNFSCDIAIVKGKGAYICGEETSLLRSIEGVPAQVSYKPPFPAVEGLWGRPTAVNNVETLHNLPWIVNQGGANYARYGFGRSRGTKAVSLNTRVRRPGLYEVELGITLRELIFDVAGGMEKGQKFKAVQVGGPLGGIFPERLLDTQLDFEAMSKAKGLLGHAGVVVYSEEDDLVEICRGLMAFCAIESCGKCFPCRIGAVRGTELFDQMMESGVTDQRVALMSELCETMKYGSLCALGGAIPTPIENLIEFFPDELAKYRKKSTKAKAKA